eukprot:TRINITY_DN93339_c0_g1_i1.p1 TRINITY_DN93339_c0_g1~~TRINITY_DN93339_c0_g1_i1.p1  ORF type:complete len:163 (+),score=29.06 TRINITY_DN93339_c0_g1_i1:51-539(+)
MKAQRRALLLVVLLAGHLSFLQPWVVQQRSRLSARRAVEAAETRGPRPESGGERRETPFYVAFLSLLLFSAPAFAQSCVDVDSASAKDLESLKGIGPALSKRIIDYRKNERTAATKDGRKTWNFQNWATLMKVDGISQSICNDNISNVCFSGKPQKACPAPK